MYVYIYIYIYIIILAIAIDKSQFARAQINWLGYQITHLGVCPMDDKMQAIQALDPPSTLKELRLFMGSLHQIGRYKDNLAQLSAPLRPLL